MALESFDVLLWGWEGVILVLLVLKARVPTSTEGCERILAQVPGAELSYAGDCALTGAGSERVGRVSASGSEECVANRHKPGAQCRKSTSSRSYGESVPHTGEQC